MPQVTQGNRAVIDTLPAKGERPQVIYRYAGDRFLLLEYGEMVLDLTMNFRIFGLNDGLKKAALDGLIETVPALRSMLIQYDSLRLPTRRLVDTLKQLEDAIGRLKPIEATVVRKRFGFDDEQEERTLADIGREHGLSRERVRQIEAVALEKIKRSLARAERPSLRPSPRGR